MQGGHRPPAKAKIAPSAEGHAECTDRRRPLGAPYCGSKASAYKAFVGGHRPPAKAKLPAHRRPCRMHRTDGRPLSALTAVSKEAFTDWARQGAITPAKAKLPAHRRPCRMHRTGRRPLGALRRFRKASGIYGASRRGGHRPPAKVKLPVCGKIVPSAQGKAGAHWAP